MKRNSVLLLFVLIVTTVISQKKAPVEYILEVDNDHRPSGWYIGGGVTYMLASPGDFLQTDSLSPSLSYTGTYNPSGKIGMNVALGRYHIFDRGFIHMLDYGLSYRKFVGEQSYAGTIDGPSDPVFPDAVTGLGEFKQNILGLNLGVNRFMGINRYFFLLHNLHLGANYRMVNQVDYLSNVLTSPVLAPENNLQGDLSYKLGLGFRMRKGLLIFSGSIPVYATYYTEDVISKMKLIHGKYHPLVFSLRYMWLNKKSDRVCPPNKGQKKKSQLFRRKMY